MSKKRRKQSKIKTPRRILFRPWRPPIDHLQSEAAREREEKLQRQHLLSILTEP